MTLMEVTPTVLSVQKIFLSIVFCSQAQALKVIETYAFYFEVEANNRVEAEEKAKEYVDKYQADKFFECATNRVFKIIPKT